MRGKTSLLFLLLLATGNAETFGQTDGVSYLACEGRYTNLCPNPYAPNNGSCGPNQLLRPQLKVVIPPSGTCQNQAICHIVISNADKLSGTYVIRFLDDTQAYAQKAPSADDESVDAGLSRVSGELRLKTSSAGYRFFTGLCSKSSRLF